MSLHYQYADMHCDTLLHGLGKGVNDIYDMPDAMLDIKRMAEANVLCQFRNAHTTGARKTIKGGSSRDAAG